jgi:hypothetical protein
MTTTIISIICFCAGMVVMSHIVRSNNKMARKLLYKETELKNKAGEVIENEINMLEIVYFGCNDPATQKRLVDRIKNLRLILPILKSKI